jgi:hypothetical protein
MKMRCIERIKRKHSRRRKQIELDEHIERRKRRDKEDSLDVHVKRHEKRNNESRFDEHEKKLRIKLHRRNEIRKFR